MTNTEKPTTKTEKNKSGMGVKPKNKMAIQKNPLPNVDKKIEEKKQEIKEEIKEKIEGEVGSIKKEPKKEIKPVVKKEFAIVNSNNLPVSTKVSADICKFINHKTIEKATSDLEQVILLKKPVPMAREIPHRKGKIMSGRFPKRTAEYFIGLLKTLKGNSNVNGIENPVICEAISNIGKRPYGKFGSVRKKRSHITIKVKERKK